MLPFFRRVARAISAIDETYRDFRREESEDVFYNLLSSCASCPIP